jgi:aminoglycoside phosphotransferase (APT) family kinase protein
VERTDRELTAEQIRSLLRGQHPDLAERSLTLGARGWDNQLWRLGEDLAVRLPWHTDAADDLLLKEHACLPVLAPLLPLPVPVPQRLGHPTEQYPHPWIITTWVPGSPADRAPVHSGGRSAIALAQFLTALHQTAPVEAPDGRGRGGNLTQIAASVESQLETLPALVTSSAGGIQNAVVELDTFRAIWADAFAAPLWEGPRLWLHGDLHPANVLTSDGDLCGVVDFGDLCAGDPALDIASCWILLPDTEAISRFRAASELASDESTWRRARGWAIGRAISSLRIATAGPPGGKPTWGPPALMSLHNLATSFVD